LVEGAPAFLLTAPAALPAVDFTALATAVLAPATLLPEVLALPALAAALVPAALLPAALLPAALVPAALVAVALVAVALVAVVRDATGRVVAVLAERPAVPDDGVLFAGALLAPAGLVEALLAAAMGMFPPCE
jgi:hypothetical protein